MHCGGFLLIEHLFERQSNKIFYLQNFSPFELTWPPTNSLKYLQFWLWFLQIIQILSSTLGK